jgi:hypothetical protein
MGKTKKNVKRATTCPMCKHKYNKCTHNCNCSHQCHNIFSRTKKHSRKMNIRGGNFYKPAAPIAGPIVGNYWKGPYSDWPGVDGIGGNRNIFPMNSYNVDPQTMMKLGGRRRKGRSRKNRQSRQKGQSKKKGRGRRKRGGTPFTQGIVNIGRSIGYNLGSSSNELRGYDAPVNPLPWKDQLTQSSYF